MPAFVKNAKREGDYEGYLNLNLLAEEQALTLPDDKFIALGDNSDNSLDNEVGDLCRIALLSVKPFLLLSLYSTLGPCGVACDGFEQSLELARECDKYCR